MLSITGCLVFLWAAPVRLAEKSDFCNQKLTGIGNGFAKISDIVTQSLEAKNSGKSVVGSDWMIVTANPYASDVGGNILLRGGTAADAMVAAQAVLGLVEPQSSGMGGGGFLVWYDSKSGELTTLDGRETAPMAASDHLFQDQNGEPIRFWDAVIGGRSVGVPGMPALWNWLIKMGKSPLGKLVHAGGYSCETWFYCVGETIGLLSMSPRMSSSSKQNPTFFQKASHWLTARCLLTASTQILCSN